jgi:hypothetical protein
VNRVNTIEVGVFVFPTRDPEELGHVPRVQEGGLQIESTGVASEARRCAVEGLNLICNVRECVMELAFSACWQDSGHWTPAVECALAQ